MRPAEKIERLIKKSRYKASTEAYDKALGSFLQAVDVYEKQKPALTEPNIWRIIMKSKITKIAAAAVIVVGLLVSVYVLDNGLSSRAFGTVIENVIECNSISLRWKSKIGMAPVPVFRMYIQGQKGRLDLIGFEGDQEGIDQIQKEMNRKELSAIVSTIIDLEHKDGLELDHFHKTYKAINVDDRMVQEFTKSNPVEQFRDVKTEDVEWLREEQQDGYKIDVYLVRHVDMPLMGIKSELSGREGERMTIWVDRVSMLPVRILLEASEIGGWFEFSDFVWNQQLDPNLFKLEVPEGYTLTDSTTWPMP